jgi:type IV secretion system protein VirD4
MPRVLPIVVGIAGVAVAACASVFLWSANYSAAVWLVSRQSSIWLRFYHGEIWLPILQAWTWRSLPIVSKLLGIATGGLIVEAAVIAGGGYVLIAAPWKVRKPSDGARIATVADLKKAGLLDGAVGYSMLLGTFKGRDVRYSGDSHFYVNGPSRSGKGRGFVMPNLLEWRGSAVVLDVKQENWALTGAARVGLGQKVYLIAPGSPSSHAWNPLDFIRAWPSRATDLMNLAASLIVVTDKGETFWAETARSLLAGVLGYVTDSATMEGRRNIRSALRMFSADIGFKELLDDIVEKEPDLKAFVIDAFNQHRHRDVKQRPSFEAHITTALKAWNNSLVAGMTASSDFDIRELRRQPFTIFIAAPVSDFGSVEPIIRLLIQQIHDVLLRNIPGPDEPHKVVLMLDEFYQFQRLPEIINRAPLVSGYGFRIALVAQNIPQIDERYSKLTREALLGNMDMKLVVAVGDKMTGDVVSDAMGKYYVEREGWGESGGSGFGRRTRQGRWEAVPLLTSDQLLRLDDAKTVLTIRGHFSAVLDKLNFYTDKRFVKRRNEVAAFAALVTAPKVEPVEEWDLFEARPAHVAAAAAAPKSETDRDDFERAVGWTAIERLASKIFVDARLFMRAVEIALSASHSAAVGKILLDLRMDPKLCGDLRREYETSLLGSKNARTGALTTINALRQAIISERRHIHERHARLYHASLGAIANEPFEAIAGGVVSGQGNHAAPVPADVRGAGAANVEPQAEADRKHQIEAIADRAPSDAIPIFGAEDLDESLLGWDETTEAGVKAAINDASDVAENDAASLASSHHDDGDVTWAELKRDVTGAGDGAVVFLAEAADRTLSRDKAEKLRGYAERLDVALRTYSRAANDENRLVLPLSV